MAFTGAVALTETLMGMNIAGITKKFAYPPDVVNSAHMPIFYVRLATIARQTTTLGYQMGLKQGAFEAVVLVGEMLLDRQEKNIERARELEDAISTALEANAAALGLDEYSITPEEDTIGGETPLWALVIRGTVSG